MATLNSNTFVITTSNTTGTTSSFPQPYTTTGNTTGYFQTLGGGTGSIRGVSGSYVTIDEMQSGCDVVTVVDESISDPAVGTMPHMLLAPEQLPWAGWTDELRKVAEAAPPLVGHTPPPIVTSFTTSTYISWKSALASPLSISQMPYFPTNLLP